MITLFKEKHLGKSFCTIEPMTMAVLGGSAISAGGSILSGLFGSKAGKEQASALRYQADVARQTALELDAKQRADLQPYMGYGTKAGDTLMGMLTGGTDVGAMIQNSPSYQWQEQEGFRMLNRQLSARGQWNSGAGMETLARFSGQLVSETENKFYDRLYNMTALGSNAAARTATNTSQIGSQLMNTQANLGMAQAGAIGQQYGAWANTASQLGSLGQTVAGFPMYQASIGALNRMGGGGGGGGYGGGAIDMNSMNPAAFGNDSLALNG